MLIPLLPMHSLRLPLTFAATLMLSGCHSAFIAATISNRGTQPLSLLEVDYPSASFGTQTLLPGQDFHYRFKILGSGPTTLLWTDSQHHDHKNSGPPLHEGQEGAVGITFDQSGTPVWNLQLTHR
jgi:hypothetical protein